MDKAFADEFSANWIDAWNKHDLAQILAHYSDDFEMTSPLIIKIAGELSGTLTGKVAVGAYWALALQQVTDLHFELVTTLIGVNSITIFYNGVSGPSAEVLFFGHDRKVTKAYAHYY